MTQDEIIYSSTALIAGLVFFVMIVSFIIYKIRSRKNKPERFTLNKEHGFVHTNYEKSKL